MTVSNNNSPNIYSGDGSNNDFDYTFRILLDSEIEAIIVDAAGVETVKTLNTHYTVSGVDAEGGGTVTFTSGNTPAATESVVLRLSMAYTQGDDYTENDKFPAETLERGLDRVTMLAQQLFEKVNRSLSFSVGSEKTAQELPTPTDDKFLVWSSGVLVNSASTQTDVTTVAGISADVTAVSAISANVTTVAGVSANVTAVAGISADVAAVGSIAGNVTTVAGLDTEIAAVAGNATNINTVAGISSGVTSLAAVSAEIGTLGAISADITTVAGISANVTTVAGNSANITTVAGISANVTAVAAIDTEIGSIVTNMADVLIVANNIDDVLDVAALIDTGLTLTAMGDVTLSSPVADSFLVKGAGDWVNKTKAETQTILETKTGWQRLIDINGALAEQDYDCIADCPIGMTISDIRVISSAGTCTATFKIGATALTGTAHSVSSTSSTQSYSAANVVAAGDDVKVTISSNSACENLVAYYKATEA